MLVNPSILTNVRFTVALEKMLEEEHYAEAVALYTEVYEVAQGLLQRCESGGHTDNTELMQRARRLFR